MVSDAPRQIDGHIVLVGLPGAGKTTVGRSVAKALGRPFLDFDLEIERRAGMSVARIFAELGEPAFRRMEVELTRELSAAPPMILSPGGGWVTNSGVIAMLRPPGCLIHLLVSPAEAVRRLSRSRTTRPLLLQADPSVKMQALWDARAGLYNSADTILNVEVVEPQAITDSIVALAHGRMPAIG
ncbi:MAG TPA: shikimate kinase [Gemmatimonas sp.]|uniref:shikimate kinase n=1 Tax=Gemmatimonas sp. TaxID=1962908 RepID=UPI002EDA28E3